MQNIQFGVARGGRLTEPVAEHIGGSRPLRALRLVIAVFLIACRAGAR
jgi:hypothetical protein